LTLTQGTCTVMQYAQVFNHLCQYKVIMRILTPANGIASV
jgi:hypothetical protein